MAEKKKPAPAPAASPRARRPASPKAITVAASTDIVVPESPAEAPAMMAAAPAARPSAPAEKPSREAIAQRAHELHRARGGSAFDNWIQAERELGGS
jgi:hypothetical protein